MARSTTREGRIDKCTIRLSLSNLQPGPIDIYFARLPGIRWRARIQRSALHPAEGTRYVRIVSPTFRIKLAVVE